MKNFETKYLTIYPNTWTTQCKDTWIFIQIWEYAIFIGKRNSQTAYVSIEMFTPSRKNIIPVFRFSTK